MTKKEYVYLDRELSWLQFNERVLQEAEDPNVPLIERLKFLGIYSNNLDEFFRVRIPTVQKMVSYGSKALPLLEFNPKKTLKDVYAYNIKLQKRFEKTYSNLKKELAKESIYFKNETELSEQQIVEVKKYFKKIVHPALVPMMLSEDRELPELNGKAIYLAIKLYSLTELEESVDVRYALIEIPTAVVPRFYVMNDTETNSKYVIHLDDLIRANLKEVFAIFDYDKIEAYTIKITRNAELDIEDDVTSSLMEKLAVSLKNRKKGDPVRFVHDAKIPADLKRFLVKKLGMQADDTVVPGGRYHNFKDYIDFPKIGSSHLRYKKMSPLDHPILHDKKSIFDSIREQDILLSYPYQSYHYIIDLLREAAIDPKVSSIKITIYRLVSRRSKVIHSLINAARNGKNVTVIVELKARFDEESNMNYADMLQDEGVNVIFGAPGLKVHTKLLLIKRKEEGKSVKYAHIGTGNFHEITANIYCDHTLLTVDTRLTNEVNKLFKFFKDNYKRYTFRHLLVAPFNARRQFNKLINQEIEFAKKGEEAEITIKVNNLQDTDLIAKLYEASGAGVKIKLIIRGINRAICGVEGMSENIEGRSIIDQKLEHARIFWFRHGGKEKLLIGSADWMTRNLDKRVEVVTPIYDKNIQIILKKVLEIQWNDNVKSRVYDSNNLNLYLKNDEPKVRSQQQLYSYFKKKAEF